MIDIKVPAVGESISEVTLVKWLKQDGEYVDRDEVIAELESEKATFEVNAEKAGLLKTLAKEGDTIKIGDVLASIDESAAKPASKAAEKPAETNATAQKSIAPVEKVASEKLVESQVAEKKAAGTETKATPVAAAI
ncbi:MAG TPA: biotin/lipoyl-containing protein, partial [Puia sp.]|nr:biotin/lipoyl-containing protein [Puia sp.]